MPLEAAMIIDCRGKKISRAISGLDIYNYSYVHAVERVLMDAAIAGINLEGATIVTTQEPCAKCARLIVDRRLSRCVFAANDVVPRPTEKKTAKILDNAGVEFIQLSGRLERKARSLQRPMLLDSLTEQKGFRNKIKWTSIYFIYLTFGYRALLFFRLGWHNFKQDCLWVYNYLNQRLGEGCFACESHPAC